MSTDELYGEKDYMEFTRSFKVEVRSVVSLEKQCLFSLSPFLLSEDPLFAWSAPSWLRGNTKTLKHRHPTFSTAGDLS